MSNSLSSKHVGLFFGSFNPIHMGHLILANHIVETQGLEELWFVVSPQNPFKEKKSLLSDHHRLDMVQRAIKNYPKMRASNVEFALPRPSYTIDTLTYLAEKYPHNEFTLIMGEDNLSGLHKWKNAKALLAKYPIMVYPRLMDRRRPEYQLPEPARIVHIDAPIIELSATHIRGMIAEGKNVRPLLPPEVFEYLDGSSFYKTS